VMQLIVKGLICHYSSDVGSSTMYLHKIHSLTKKSQK